MSEQLTQATRETKENLKKTAEIDKDVDFLMNKMQSLAAEVNATEHCMPVLLSCFNVLVL